MVAGITSVGILVQYNRVSLIFKLVFLQFTRRVKLQSCAELTGLSIAFLFL